MRSLRVCRFSISSGRSRSTRAVSAAAGNVGNNAAQGRGRTFRSVSAAAAAAAPPEAEGSASSAVPGGDGDVAAALAMGAGGEGGDGNNNNAVAKKSHGVGWGAKSRRHWERVAKQDERRAGRLTMAEQALRQGVLEYQRSLAEDLGDNPMLPVGIQREIYGMHLSSPQQWTLARLAKKYGLDQVRVAAVLRQQGDEHRQRRIKKAVADAAGVTLERIRAHDRAVSRGEPGVFPVTDEEASAVEPVTEAVQALLPMFGITENQIVEDFQNNQNNRGGGVEDSRGGRSGGEYAENRGVDESDGGAAAAAADDAEETHMLFDVIESIDPDVRERLAAEATRFRLLTPEARDSHHRKFLTLRQALGAEIANSLCGLYGKHPTKYNPTVLSQKHNVPVEVVVALLVQEGFEGVRIPTAPKDLSGESFFVTSSHDLSDPSNAARGEEAEPSYLQLVLRERLSVMTELEGANAYMYRKFEDLTDNFGVDSETGFAQIRAEQRDREEEDGHRLRQTGAVDEHKLTNSIGWGEIPDYGHLLEEPRRRNVDWPMYAFVHPDEDANEWAVAMQDARINRKVRTRYNWRRGKWGVKLAPPKHELPAAQEELAYYQEEEEDLNHAYGGRPTDAIDQSKRERRRKLGPRKAVLDLLGLSPEDQKRATEIRILREGSDDYIPWPRIHLKGRKYAMPWEKHVESYTFIGSHPKLSDAQKPIYIMSNVTGEVRTPSWPERRALLNPTRRPTPGEIVRKELLPLYALQRKEDMEYKALMEEGVKRLESLDAIGDGPRSPNTSSSDALDDLFSSGAGEEIMKSARALDAGLATGVASSEEGDDAEEDGADPDDFDATYRRDSFRRKARLADWAELDEDSRDLLRQQTAEIGDAASFEGDGEFNANDDGIFDSRQHARFTEFVEHGEEPAEGVAVEHIDSDGEDDELDLELLNDDTQ